MKNEYVMEVRKYINKNSDLFDYINNHVGLTIIDDDEFFKVYDSLVCEVNI